MPAHKKEKIACTCNNCPNIVYKNPAQAKTFRYCSKECEWAAKIGKVPHNKLTIDKLVFSKCKLETCNKGRYIRPRQAKKGEYKFCSNKCKNHFRSKQYQLELEELRKKKQEEVKRNIWLV